jgi:hypothetical protein
MRCASLEARLPHGDGNDPAAQKIDGVPIALVHGRHAPPGKGAVQGIARIFTFEDRDELLLVPLEAAQNGLGDFDIHLDVTRTGKGEGVERAGRAGEAEEAAKDVGEKIREEGSLVEIVRSAGSDETGPMPEFGLSVLDMLRQDERPHLLADDLRMKEQFGFESHLSRRRLYREWNKPSGLETRRRASRGGSADWTD